MAGTFYVHRLTKLLEEFVIGNGLTLHISDETGMIKLKDHVTAAKAIADSLGVRMAVRSENGVTMLSFQK